jgi:transcription elongation factor Elf1
MNGNERRTCSSCGWKTVNGTVVERADGTRVWRCASCAATEAFIAKVAASSAVPDAQDWFRSLEH